MGQPVRDNDEFQRLIDRLTPDLRKAFLKAWQDVRTGIDWPGLRAALARGDVDGAVDALGIEPAAFEAYRAAATNAYAQGGALATTHVNGPKGSRVTFRFDMTNPRAEEWIKQNVGQRIVGIAGEARQAAREAIQTGYAAGRHPNGIALDLAGRVSEGSRAGGVLDLDGPRAERLQAVIRGMETPEGVRDLVEVVGGKPQVRYKVNAATEARIIKAWRAGTAVPDRDREISARQYHNALLQARAETVARTETGQAVMSARFEEWRQAAEKLGYPLDRVVKKWTHGGGKDARWWHLQAEGLEVRGLETPFILANGAVMQHALDPAGGAKECTNCGCNTLFRLTHTP